MFIKFVVIIAFLFIIASLGSALFHLVKRGNQDDSEKTVRALTWRIGLSMALFLLIVIAYATGLIKPTGIGARIQYLKSHPTKVAS